MRLLVGVGADVDQHLVPAVAQTRVHRGGGHTQTTPMILLTLH